jgi:alkyl hydroperoxide reductase subunit F
VGRPGQAPRIHFAGLPMGHEFSSLVLALLQAGGHPPKADEALIAQIRGIAGRFRFETFISLSCHNCPDVVQALNTDGGAQPEHQATMVDGALFQDEVARGIMAVPAVFLNGAALRPGAHEHRGDPGEAGHRCAEREAARRSTPRQPFDVLVVGGGPAGAAAAIYAARKGIRTGVVAERFGGQVLDTLAIENFISVPHRGAAARAALESTSAITASTSCPCSAPRRWSRATGCTKLKLASGATLKAKTVILATGARWREMNVPGEAEYKREGRLLTARTATARCSRASASR